MYYLKTKNVIIDVIIRFNCILFNIKGRSSCIIITNAVVCIILVTHSTYNVYIEVWSYVGYVIIPNEIWTFTVRLLMVAIPTTKASL